ncbi:hypothetical protein AB0B04_18855 [Streptomyces xinghaiensis]|uniref:Tetratricopeptide repeat protein n=2 Tax=Streptomyces TaxID=1883 RepID=A0A3M8EYC3_9ACTN|nr:MULTISPECIES: hypothetical protein [Streptomyces]KNE81388.1 hypothetical protein ADZ36_16540 [Streptomyces fradiae]OFA48273.1 hypothetical protein BEN35_19225 [Streptomyces fradiae]PQM20658.1 hypothetical protein Sfr7A_26090 [Streptomyces xinghaiensis]RKM92598.1 hypothetical protein SFRA_024745 [Streptomyces xinghaiensis]RNC70566.1 hypothetical protein DC095_025735 [Streptomyces xinghaiensis]
MDTDTRTNPPGLDTYPAAIQETIRSEADVWRYGNVASALASFEETVAWARGLNQEQRKYHKSGCWYTNDNMNYAAIALVQQELGDDPDCASHLCPTGADCHPAPAARTPRRDEP